MNEFRYIIDTNVLALIRARRDFNDLYEGLISLAVARKLRTVRQVFEELKAFEGAYNILREHREAFVVPPEEQFDLRVSQIIEELGNTAPWLWQQTGSKNPDPADPWLIGVAKTFDYTVVTNESARKEKRIPAACRLPTINCRCIHGPHFLVEVGLVKTIKPEHIDPAAFFANGE